MTSTIGQLGDITVGMPILARQARVAIGDEIVLLAELSPGRSPIRTTTSWAPVSSLSAYTTYAPRPGLPDSRRNCISNVRQDAGLSVAAASAQLARLLRAALEQRVSGIGLHLEPMRSISGPLDTEHGRYRHAGAPTDTRLTRTGSRRGNVESERADAVDLNRHGSTITTRCAFDRFRMWTSPSAQCTSIVMVQPVGCQNSQLRR
jgi:hypothetical protein